MKKIYSLPMWYLFVKTFFCRYLNWSLRIGCLIVFITLYSSVLMAQNDVTSNYLTNAGFDSDCEYEADGTETITTAASGVFSTIEGWSLVSEPVWSVAATFEYGWSGVFNSVSIPSSGLDGETGEGHGVLGLTTGWGSTLSYSQSITLPVGYYSVVFVEAFEGVTSASATVTGWIPDDGDAVYSDLTSVENLDQWYSDTITFIIKEETSGAIQVGYTAANSSSSVNPKVFVDQVKIVDLGAYTIDLQILQDSASVMLANPQSTLEGSSAYSDLQTVYNSVQTILDNSSATEVEVLQAEENIQAAIDDVYYAIFMYSLSSATYEKPVEATERITNADFQDDSETAVGWVTSLGIYYGSNAVYTGAPSPNYVMDGDPVDTTTGYQTVSGILSGIYKVKAIARGRNDGTPKMFIGVQVGDTLESTTLSQVEVDRIGDTGGDLDYGFNQYSTPFVIVPENDDSLTLGIFFEGDCGWSSVDNFQLVYYGNAEDAITALKSELSSLKDSSDVPSSMDLSEIETLIATDPTSENMNELAINLDNKIEDIKDSISYNTDATLSDIEVDGNTISGFSSNTFVYHYTIYSSQSETPDVPATDFTLSSRYAQITSIDSAKSIQDTTIVLVTAGNGSKNTYKISFSFTQLQIQEDLTATYDTLGGAALELSGKGQITLTGDVDPLNGSVINLVSTDEWIYFPNMKPSEVQSSSLEHILINNEEAELNVNVRIAQYINGAMVIPHSSTYNALTVYSDTDESGTAMNFISSQHYTGSTLGEMENNIESFILKKGYMATFASNEDGTGISRVYIANNSDITVNQLPDGLLNTVSFIVVRPWRWTTKKGWRGSSTTAAVFNAGSYYDYNNSAESTLDQEYVPMRHNPNWNSYSNFYDKYTSTHALGFNEPNNSSDDGYATVETTIEQWPEMMESGLRLGSPATTDGGLSWLAEFMAEAEALDYRVDFVAWHFYRAGYTAQSYYNTLKAIYDAYQRPIWITEFNNGCNWTYDDDVPTLEENGEAIESFIQMLDTTSFVERYYVWDGCNETLRMTNSSTGELYPAGVAYQNLESTISYTLDYYNDQDTSIIKTYSATDIDDVSITSDEAVLYPNPVDNYFNVKINEEYEKAMLFIYNSSGTLIKNAVITGKEEVVDCTELSSGFYAVKIIFNNKVVVRKIMVK